METLKMLEHQVDRMECFSSTMKEIHTFEERQTIRANIAVAKLFELLEKNVRGLSSDKVALELTVTPSTEQEAETTIICDHSLIQEVVDNLVANAIRFTKDKVRIELCLENDKLYVYVKDNGSGFSQDALLKGTRPYYSTEEEHFGLGLTISQLLCKKHGGNLELMNSIDGGAIVCAYFYVR
jgi:signal transduction histidine kinase